MTGSKYSFAVSQLEYHVALHPDAHMLFTKMQEEHPDIITAIMTKPSLKAGLREWVTKAHSDVHSNMKQLHFRIKLKSM